MWEDYSKSEPRLTSYRNLNYLTKNDVKVFQGGGYCESIDKFNRYIQILEVKRNQN